jgi:hypothetical protein
MKAKLACMISGSPGTGKSEIVRSIAQKFDLVLIDERLSTYDSTDLNGFPRITESLAEYVPFGTFPLEGITELPKGKTGFLVFLDEFNSAPLSVQASAYRLVLDRQVGKYNLHPKTVVVCAGNLMTDGAIVNRMGTAMQSRLVHLELGVFPKEWLAWGNTHGMDHRILAYIAHAPDNLHRFDPKHDDKTFSCPRTWHFASRLIKGIPTEDLKDLSALLAGTVGAGSALEFIAYTQIYEHMPTYEEILKDPLNARLDKEPAMNFAVSHMISAFLKKPETDQAMKYITRLPVEFQMITLQNIMQKDQTIREEPVIQKWLLTKGMDLL